ncbi:toxin ParE1/3/4 [Dyadobacter jejuensis]|uniref:Toxin n=1 Tax=Dyadobacter jejuensis TaxID=1082580 RepID=A0A316AM96_9BACT|nr:type II toxin-antitoxin system RelE/ParE family toxin [Dyadobacter jejuensis]PWJ58184.1 toxin ParE1/3/4 [Dyadobacter jejuensis]
MSKYKLTKQAEHDLVKIWDYTVHEWSVNQAERYIDSLVSSFEGIAAGRIKGKAIDSVRKGYMKTMHGKHYIFFRFSPDNIVEIIRILHVSMDIERYL